MKILIVIPARGGSKGIPKKNIRFMQGKPLIAYAIGTAKKIEEATVVVTSDDDEILEISEIYGAVGIKRTDELATDNVTLDPVVQDAVIQMEQLYNKIYDIVITMQPTSPLLTADTLQKGVEYFEQGEYDTVISGVNRPHLSWRIQGDLCIPNYEKRLNRQYLPKNLVETGAFVITKRTFVTENSRFGNKVSIYEMPEREAVDIDTPQDWWIAENELGKKKILIHVAGYDKIGTGHIYRCLQIASTLIEHEVLFVVNKQSDLAIKIIGQNNYSLEVISQEQELIKIAKEKKIDIIINDILNTSESYMKQLRQLNARIINFEDLGDGAEYADAVINDIYEKRIEGEKYFWSSDYYIIKEEFKLAVPKSFSPEVKEIMILFGGTDPNNLTQKVLQVLLPIVNEYSIHVTIILGLGYKEPEKIKQQAQLYENIEVHQNVKRISRYMERVDLAISSSGRTMYELAYMGIPTILLAQNDREMEHVFGGMENGYLNLGMGTDIEKKTLENTIKWLIDCPAIRQEMHECLMKKDLKNGLARVKKIILNEEV